MASRAPSLAFSLTVALLVPACGDDGDATTANTDTDPTSSSTTDAEPTTGSTTSTTGTSGDDPTASPTSPATSTGDDPATSTGDDPATSSTTDDQTTGDLDCVTIMPGPFTPELVGGGYDGSEDLGFDGAGGLALKRDDAVVIVTADLQEKQLTNGLPQVFGTRFATSGDLLVALPQSGDLLAIAGDGATSDLAGNLDSPNGLFVDTAGRVWLTEFGGSRVVRFDADFTPTTVYEGPLASTVNGVVLDEARGLLFFTNYGAGRLLKLALDDFGDALGEPVEVLAVPGAALDGLALDACGNVYAVDQSNGRLFRGILDGEAELVGQPELLAEFDSGVANAQFGRGPGWDPESLYLSGNPGDLWRVTVGVEGAPIGLP